MPADLKMYGAGQVLVAERDFWLRTDTNQKSRMQLWDCRLSHYILCHIAMLCASYLAFIQLPSNVPGN